MKVFISGICGTGMGPLALMAREAGISVSGSDIAEGMILPELLAADISVAVGPQDGSALRASGADWFVHTSALSNNAPEMVAAKELGMRISKRDELIAYLVSGLGLSMVAVAGTHGKTTTTGLIVWACLKLGIPVSYLVGTTLGFAPAGHFEQGSKYFIYEADEYDRNFLHFHPWLAVITAVSYDHPDIYPTVADYQAAFSQFEEQSTSVIRGGVEDSRFTLSGALRRQDATMALLALRKMEPSLSEDEIIAVLNAFPGISRRFEAIFPGVYSDYAHHPEEVAETLKMASEEASRGGFKGVVAVYEPHQNTRQHQVKEGYTGAFNGVSNLFWLPTYLTREDPSLTVITPAEFIAGLSGVSSGGRPITEVAEAAKADDALAARLRELREQGYLILLMTAGPADAWFREVFRD